MAKKRPTLDAFLNSQVKTEAEETSAAVIVNTADEVKKSKKSVSEKKRTENAANKNNTSTSDTGKHEIVRHMMYLPVPVYDQLQGLIYEEQRGRAKRRKTHDYLLDAIDLLFKEKGLKSIAKLIEKKD